jgi:prolipoprotein diacylglyceryltransferase
MHDEFFVAGLAVVFAVLLRWAFITLPKEDWQFMASVPIAKEGEANWKGLNLTYYGFFTAIATVAAVSVMLILLGSIGVPAKVSLAIVCLLAIICFPAAKLVARVVEQKPHTFTIGGASFVGAIAAPAIVWLVGFFFRTEVMQLPMLPALAAIAIAYALGEGLGRLACISFGCCYGKSMCQCGPLIRRVFGAHSFIFWGKTKKIAYEGALDGTDVVPIQAVTAVSHIAVSLLGILLYLKSYYSIALIAVMAVTQLWRALSETLRADYRGGGRISAYQIMSLVVIAYALLLYAAIGEEPLPTSDLNTGLVMLWDPAVILLLESLGFAGFLYAGRSMVTSSTISYHVQKDRI